MAALSMDEMLRIGANLVVPGERWGWEYVPPRERSHPVPEPVDPPPPDDTDVRKRRAALPPRRRRALVFALKAGFGLFIALLLNALTSSYIPLVLAGGLVLALSPFYAGPYLLSAYFIGRHRRRLVEIRTVQAQTRTAWELDRASWTTAEQQRVAAEDVWFPVDLTAASRIDVFGGTPETWAALLVTMGGAALGNGTDVLILDMSEDEVATPLAELALSRGLSVGVRHMPADLDRVDLLTGLEADEIAEVVAGAVQGLRPDNPEGRMSHVGLIEAVASRLVGPVTFEKLGAGLRVLDGSYDEQSPGSALSAVELQQLAAYVDSLGTSERAQDELRFLLQAVDTLLRHRSRTSADAATSTSPDGYPLGSRGLTVLTSTDRNHKRRQFVDGLLVHSLVHQLGGAATSTGGARPVLVLAGVGDHIGSATVELLTRRAQRAGVRLVLMMEHLRGDMLPLLGAAGSASIVMQLGNAAEAAAAAEFIGRQHTFVVSQLTRQSSESRGEQDSTADGWNRQKSESGSGRAEDLWFGLAPPTRGWLTSGFTDETPATYGETGQRTQGSSRETSESHGSTKAQEYRFQVEPTTIQALAPMTYLSVIASGGVRRIAAGSCDPRMVTVERLSPSPRSDTSAVTSQQAGSSPAGSALPGTAASDDQVRRPPSLPETRSSPEGGPDTGQFARSVLEAMTDTEAAHQPRPGSDPR